MKKERITKADIESLTADQKNSLKKWWVPKRGDFFLYDGKEELIRSINENVVGTHLFYNSDGVVTNSDLVMPLLNGFQMICFLYDNNIKMEMDNCNPCSVKTWKSKTVFIEFEPCDALFMAIKEIL